MITALEISERAIGNALFTYATLFGVGKKLNLDIKIPTGINHIHNPTGQDIIQLKDIFNITTPDITQEEVDSIKHTYVEKKKDFNPEIFEEVRDWTNLVGFYQDEGYYSHCIPELKKELTIKDRWINCAKYKAYLLGIDLDNCIFMHVRRGDFTSPHLAAFHPLLSGSYYNKSLDTLNKIGIKCNQVLIFSDDIDYCKSVVKSSGSLLVIDNRGFSEYNPVVDFTMMSLCKKGAILANSSFSYWSAWIGNQDLVICPKVYCGPGYNWFNPMKNEKWIKI